MIDKLIDKVIDILHLPMVDGSSNHDYYLWGGGRRYGLPYLVVWYLRLFLRRRTLIR